MANDESFSLGPVSVREVKRVNENADGPIAANKTGEANGGAIASKKFGMQSKGEGSACTPRCCQTRARM